MYFKKHILGVLLLTTFCCASVIPTVEVLQGPSSKTILLGPDGSAIDAESPGGTLVTNDHGSGLVAAGPAILSAGDQYALGNSPLGPELAVNGPAGSIITSYRAAGPAEVPGILPEANLIAGSVDVSLNGGDLEGAYKDDNTEALYDNGSYKED